MLTKDYVSEREANTYRENYAIIEMAWTQEPPGRGAGLCVADYEENKGREAVLMQKASHGMWRVQKIGRVPKEGGVDSSKGKRFYRRQFEDAVKKKKKKKRGVAGAARRFVRTGEGDRTARRAAQLACILVGKKDEFRNIFPNEEEVQVPRGFESQAIERLGRELCFYLERRNTNGAT